MGLRTWLGLKKKPATAKKPPRRPAPTRRKTARETFLANAPLRDDERFLQLLAFGMTFSHARAKQSLQCFIDCREEWRRSGSDPAWDTLQDEEKDEFILRLLSDIVLDSIRRAAPGRPLTMGLAGGFDSRAILYVLRKAGVPVRTYTWGQIGHFDFDLVRLLAARLQLDTVFMDTSSMEWSLRWFDEAAPKTQDIATWARVLATREMDALVPGRMEVHGYLGAAISGARLPSPLSSQWSAAVRRFCTQNDAYGFQRLLPFDAAEFLPSQPLLDPDDFHLDSQLDLGYRLPQRIRPVPDPVTASPVLPLEHRRWVGFWLNRGLQDLSGQSRLLRVLRKITEEFFELALCSATTRNAIQKERRDVLYGSADRPKLVDLTNPGKVLPRNPGKPFCFLACYRNNESFRRMIGQSIARLRAREVFPKSFVDRVLQRFERGEETADKMLRGLVVVDLVLETERFR